VSRLASIRPGPVIRILSRPLIGDLAARAEHGAQITTRARSATAPHPGSPGTAREKLSHLTAISKAVSCLRTNPHYWAAGRRGITGRNTP